jgi:hypothetical protein
MWKARKGTWDLSRQSHLFALLATCFHAGIFLGLFFDPEDGGDMLFRNISLLLRDYVKSQKIKLFRLEDIN